MYIQSTCTAAEPPPPPPLSLPLQVLGLDKRSFLRAEVLREVGRTRQHQKLVSEYTEYLREAGK